MWTRGNYRRIFLDMHIDDSKPEYLSRLDEERIVESLKEAGAQMVVVKGRPHTGLALFPTENGRMHRGLQGRDYVGTMLELCHKNNIAVQLYFSQIFDNWAYENHPEWRVINGEGHNSMDTADGGNPSLFRKGRYGIVCPNNQEYREYVKACLTELTEKYEFESIFLDMPFWPEVCFCSSCRAKYHRAAGREIPRIIDWGDPAFRKWQRLREEWMGEFAAFSADCVKKVRPEVTIEHNLSLMANPWVQASTELIAEVCDYAGGDMYGGYLEQSFMCKYYRNISKTLPFEFITSRCEPCLEFHTTTKSDEELLLHTVIALFHDGAVSICDGMNPDGTIAEQVYKGVIKKVFSDTAEYVKYVEGERIYDMGIWYPTHSKCSWMENGKPVTSDCVSKEFLETYLNMAGILRERHFLFDVVPSKKLKKLKARVLIVCNVVTIQDKEMEDIEAYVRRGGCLYISGHIGHPRLYELLEADYEGMTRHTVTYMSPTQEGREFFTGFDAASPPNIQAGMEQLGFHGACQVLATITLPYTMTDTCEFASIHSNPPGISTARPAVVIKKVGDGKILWSAAAIENSRPYMSRQAAGNLLGYLNGKASVRVKAPACVEVVCWKNDRTYLAVLNEQERAPFIPVNDIVITIPKVFRRAVCICTEEELQLKTGSFGTEIVVRQLEVFRLIALYE